MRRYTQTIIRILLVVLLLTALSGGGNMAYALSGSGTSSNPYTISSEEDWKDIANSINNGYISGSCNIKLENDTKVYFTATSHTIGNSTDYPFKGTFDGQGHTLTTDSKSIDTSTKLESQTAGNLIFVGTFQDMTNEYATKNGSYILQADGTWTIPEDADGETCLEAFHAYLHFKNRSAHFTLMTMTLTDSGKVDPEPSAIDSVILEDEAGEQIWYDLNGRRIDKPQKGVNILRTSTGKTRKVVIR